MILTHISPASSKNKKMIFLEIISELANILVFNMNIFGSNFTSYLKFDVQGISYLKILLSSIS